MHRERKYFGCVERPKSPHVWSSASDWLFMAKGNERSWCYSNGDYIPELWIMILRSFIPYLICKTSKQRTHTLWIMLVPKWKMCAVSLLLLFFFFFTKSPDVSKGWYDWYFLFQIFIKGIPLTLRVSFWYTSTADKQHRPETWVCIAVNMTASPLFMVTYV